MSPTFPDWSSELQEALWEAATDHGVQLKVSEQIAIARAVASQPREAVTPHDVRAAFLAVGLPRPSAAYARAVLSSVQGVRPRASLLDVLLKFRRDAIRTLSREFGGNTKGREDELRDHLLMYLPQRGYAEAHTGKGKTDILIPPPVDAIIETKVWTTKGVFRDGVVELERYIHTEHPKQAYMVVFGDREPLPSIIAAPTQETADTQELGGLTVPVVVVPFEVDVPSKAAANQRRRDRAK